MHTPRSRSFLFSCLLLVVGASALAAVTSAPKRD